jgi:PPP family 3-phenylpropionic acid transporter
MTQALDSNAPASTRWGVDRALLVPKAFYFCYYAASSSLLPFLALYYHESGLSGGQIGILVSLSPIVTWFAAPFWGVVADNTRQHRLILTLTIICSALMVGLLGRVNGFWLLLPVVVLYAFFCAPIIPLVDNSVMTMLGERSRLYGKQRVWVSIGWGVSAAGAGLLVDRYGQGISFYVYIFFFIILAFISTRFRMSRGAIVLPFWQGMRALASNRALIVFLITTLFASMGSAIVNNYVFIYLKDLGASGSLLGISLTVATLSEMPVFFFSATLLRIFGARGLLLLSLSAYVVRLMAYTLIPPVWLLLPINLLHGLTFAALWAAGVSYANEVAPTGMGATAQGLFTGVTMGLGSAVGAVVAGLIFETYGPLVMFRAGAVIVLVGIIFFVIAGRRQN